MITIKEKKERFSVSKIVSKQKKKKRRKKNISAGVHVELRGTVNSWHAESGGVISLITLSLPSLTGVFEEKKIH